MSLDIALQNAVSGLRASQAQIQVVAGNISNAQTPGYNEETIPLETQVTPSGGAGVITGTIQRATNQILAANLLTQTTTAANASTLSNAYQQLQALLGQVNSGDTIADQLNNFSSSLQALTTQPDSTVAQENAILSGQTLATSLNQLSSGVQTLRQDADTQLGTDITTLDSALQTIASLNPQIVQQQAEGQPTASLEDERDQALNTVAQLIGVSSYTRADGTMVVVSDSGQTLVDGAVAEQLQFQPVGTMTATTAVSPVTLDGVDVSSKITTGQIGALLELRDSYLPGVTAQLNQFSNALFNLTATPNLQTTNSGLNATNDANHFFANVDTANGVDNAATIEVNPSLVDDPALLDTDTTGAQDSSISIALNNNVAQTTSFAAAGSIGALNTSIGAYASQIISQAANIAANASSNATFQSSLQTQLSTQLSSTTGVNVDAELSNLIVYQNAYGASARVVTAIQDMYDTLMKM
jgi:flagellar hook-associated protein 1